MEDPKKIDTKKTEDSTGDAQRYGDASDLDVTHYMGNNENIPREEVDIDEEEVPGQVAYGNVETPREEQQPGSP